MNFPSSSPSEERKRQSSNATVVESEQSKISSTQGSMAVSPSSERSHEIANAVNVGLSGNHGQSPNHVKAPEKNRHHSAHSIQASGKINSEVYMDQLKSIRTWFKNLPTGEARSSAVAIHDKHFIQLYIDTIHKNHRLNSISSNEASKNSSSKGVAKSCTSQITLIPEISFSRGEIIRLYEDLQNKNEGRRTNNVHTASSMKCEENIIQPKDSNVLPSKIEDDEPVMTLHFLSGDKTLPNSTTSRLPKPSMSEKTRPHPDVAAPQSIMDGNVYSKTPSELDAKKKEIIASKKKAAKAIASVENVKINNAHENDEKPPQHVPIIEKQTDSLDHASEVASPRSNKTISWLALQSFNNLHRNSCLVSSQESLKGEILADSENKSNKNCRIVFDSLVLDPEFLNKDNGDNLFLFANRILQQKQHSNGRLPGFLSSPPSKCHHEALSKGIISVTMWPAWLDELQSDDSKELIPFHLLLLARMEMSIWSSYLSHLRKKKIVNKSTDPVLVKSASSASPSACDNHEKLVMAFTKAKKLQKHGQEIGPNKTRELIKPLFTALNSSLPNSYFRADSVIKHPSMPNDLRLDHAIFNPLPLLLPYPSKVHGESYMLNYVSYVESLDCILKIINEHTEVKLTSKSKKKKKKKKKQKNNVNALMCDRPTTQESETKLQSRNGEKPPEQKQPNAWKNPESSAENQPKRSTPKNAESISTQSPKDSASVITKIPSTSDVTLKIQRGSSAVVVEQLPSAVTDDSHSGDDWSMVGSKGKSNRGKTSQKQSILEQSEPTSKSKKKSGKSQSRKRVNQKAVKEMMSTLIETPSLEKQQQHHQQQPQTVNGNTKSLQTIEGTTTPSEDKKDKHPPSLRDIVAGKVSTSRVLPTPSLDTVGTPKKVIPKSSSITATLTPLGSSLASKVSKELAASRRSGQTAVMTKKSLNADQSTAPTLPETLSGVSANTRSHNSSASVPGQPEVSVGNDSNSGDIDMKTKSHSPPLPTLLSGPGNTNSATSSVASSLEHPREQNTSGKETDVGYHLLSVCERLNKDMGTFMTRRRLALDVRRRERGTLLSALQDIAAKIWVGRCRVEMYGSCATQLDLPSSDLDAVICGLPIPKQQKKKKHGDGSDPIDQYHYHGNQSVNGGRVLRLAEELERQPWVVQIKPIPTATVPVIKILADPARVHGSGASNTGSDWRIQQQCTNSSNSQIASQTNSFHNSPSHYISSSSSPGQIMQPYPTPWRGADVMNGLIKLDITFEGPEHGGIGSTAYTARVVQDACNETGLPPESTPTVQVTMVLKELLAQRRLNEPFSGGLSSYALLLMVVAIMRERRAIRAEMALAERQRRAVASTNASSMRTISNPSQQPKPVVSRSNSCTSLSSRNAVIPSTCTSVSSVSSWASIAKKSELPQRTHSSDKVPPVQQPIKEKVLTKSNSSSQLPPSHVIKKPVSVGSGPLPSSTFNFAPGSNDVLEVLCSGEETAGKLLMHCLLFYGHYFNAQSMVIDVTAPEYGRGPFTARRQGGLIDPVSGVFTVDPIVVYDPLEGAEGNNVARSCFAWINIRSVFAQCYTTLQHTVERKGRIDYGSSDSPCLLELLLSF